MDALTVIGVVANILQLISSAHGVLSFAKEAYSSTTGLVPAIEQLRLLVDDVKLNVADIVNDSMQSSNSLNNLKRIADECIKLGNNLLQRFEEIRSKKHGWQRKAESLKNAAIFMYSREEINKDWTTLQALTARVNRWWEAEVNR
ncbi:hypothetical protein RRF57_012118 [Xylaria bambusicola]|uniref:Fungal N-terminal domain-containing protein n=1 Tax=Xylaria bambusicola TaxID=326684 RepID=A0AAN7V1D4_9PEZI